MVPSFLFPNFFFIYRLETSYTVLLLLYNINLTKSWLRRVLVPAILTGRCSLLRCSEAYLLFMGLCLYHHRLIRHHFSLYLHGWIVSLYFNIHVYFNTYSHRLCAGWRGSG